MSRNRILSITILFLFQFMHGASGNGSKMGELPVDWSSLIGFIINSLGPFLVIQLPLITVLISVLFWMMYMRLFKIQLPSVRILNWLEMWTRRASFFSNIIGVTGTFIGFVVLIKFMAENGSNGNQVPWVAGAMALSTTIAGLIAIALSYEPILWFESIRKDNLVEAKDV